MLVGYRWYVGDLKTGKISRQVDLVDTRWTTSFDYGVPGTLEGSFPLRAVDPAMGGPIWPDARADTAPGKAFLAVSYMDQAGIETFIEGGPIWTSKYNDTTGVLQVGAAGLSTYFDERKLIAAGFQPGDDVSAMPVTLVGAQLGIIAKQIVAVSQAIQIGGMTVGALPIVLPADADLGGLTPAAHTRTYPGYELGWVGERLKQLTQVENGPELQFVPRRRADDPRFIEWGMRIGVEADAMLLTQDGPPWQFDRTVPSSDVRDIDIDTDGKGVAERMWAAGEGEAEGRPVVVADNSELLDLGWPLLEGEITSTDTVSEASTLRGHAQEGLAIGARPREAWVMTVSRDGRPNVGQYRPGDWAQVRVRDHDYLPDGDFAMRMLAVSGGGDSGDVQITLSERLGDF